MRIPGNFLTPREKGKLPIYRTRRHAKRLWPLCLQSKCPVAEALISTRFSLFDNAGIHLLAITLAYGHF